jgi:hypothetical protein
VVGEAWAWVCRVRRGRSSRRERNTMLGLEGRSHEAQQTEIEAGSPASWSVFCPLSSVLCARASARLGLGVGELREKGIWWMPWHREAMKDVARCEKLGGEASTLGSRDLRMGQPTASAVSSSESIAWRGEPGELNHLSSRRKGHQPRLRE